MPRVQQAGLEEAEMAYREQIAEGYRHAWHALGYLLSQQPGREGEAEAAYWEAIAEGDTNAWANLGYLLSEQPGREGEAATAYRAAVDGADADEVVEAAALRVGELLARQGDFAGAQAAFERYVRALAKRWDCELSDSTVTRLARFGTAVRRRPRVARLGRSTGYVIDPVDRVVRAIYARIRRRFV